MIETIEEFLGARTAAEVWTPFVSRLATLGFPSVMYFAMRFLETPSDQLVNDRILLSTFPERLRNDILCNGQLESLPLYRKLSCEQGWLSWDWMRTERSQGRTTVDENEVMDLFGRFGHVGGYGMSMLESVPRVRAGIVFLSDTGRRQDKIDELWQKNAREIIALTGLAHLRISSLPYAQPDDVLTARQREVLEAISVGQTMAEIAERLEVTPATIEKHLRLARRALGARTTAQAIILASIRRHIFSDSGFPETRPDSTPSPQRYQRDLGKLRFTA
ncbi:helix-turn-helix transcriptional regulator [Paracoccus sulfuroxidans]|uniref:Autoinducer binding domain-containing protein n=1 Tax=Paracoccus sulfuroxidans TaxID=384678 RepID=A0A562P160_9RHOB|nr:LuxR family transcriptional regulator [Paracoccus sulfuroxidans]TWI38139.1 autoinducer binding domain-containing protein [Paracoccus sulfuroxidans]